jgi:hypothetical protein
MKTCNKCRQTKAVNNFFADKGNKTDGRASICKICKTSSIYAWREKNKDKYNAYMRQKNKEQYPKDRLRRYGITLEQHQRMLVEQDSKCAVCGKAQMGKRPLVVDHDHETDIVRELLCYKCNRDMATLDDPNFERLLAYKRKHEGKKAAA